MTRQLKLGRDPTCQFDSGTSVWSFYRRQTGPGSPMTVPPGYPGSGTCIHQFNNNMLKSGDRGIIFVIFVNKKVELSYRSVSNCRRHKGSRIQYKPLGNDSDIKKTLGLSGQKPRDLSLIQVTFSHLFRIGFVMALDSKRGSPKISNTNKTIDFRGCPTMPD